MKLQLVMLTTVISMITERQVEAQIICFENRNATGFNHTFTKSSKNIVGLFPTGAKSCKIPAKTAIIFYTELNFEGHETAFYGQMDKIFIARYRYIFKSFYLIGQPSPDGIHSFERRRFQGGLTQSFSNADDNVTDGHPLLSAVVIGPDDWTIATDCNGKTCLTCLKADEHGGASFIRHINNGASDVVISVSRGNCSGTEYIGKPSIPECPCNQHGTVDGPDKCEGVNGICQCSSSYRREDCDACKSGFTYREGKCVAGCACFLPGVRDGSGTCPCRCKWPYEGGRCETCVWYNAYKNYDGRCISNTCMFKNTRRVFSKYDGRCNCKSRYFGNCDRCKKPYHLYGKRCLNGPQFDKVMELEHFRDSYSSNKTHLFKILDELVKLGVLMSHKVKDGKDNVNYNWKTVNEQARSFLRYQSNWRV